MSITEIFTALGKTLSPLLPSVLVLTVLTVLAMLAIYFFGRNIWIKNKKFPLSSLFFGLDGVGTLCLACAWIKLVLPIVYIVSFEKIVLIQFLVLLIPGLILAFCSGSIKNILSGIFYLALELLGVVCVSLVCGYITEMRAGMGFALVYLTMGIFVGLFAVYLFLQEIEHISSARKIDPEKIWRTADEQE